MKRIFTYVVLGVLLLILTGCAFQTNDNDAQMEEKLKQLQETVAVLQEQNAKEQEEQKVKDEEVQFYYTPINADWGTQEEDTQPINPYDSIEEAKENVIRLNGYVNIDSVNGYDIKFLICQAKKLSVTYENYGKIKHAKVQKDNGIAEVVLPALGGDCAQRDYWVQFTYGPKKDRISKYLFFEIPVE